jgi:NAD-specific glutamate dehydrogenase
VKSATINAEKAPNERQSRDVRGFVKLKAKMMNTSEFKITSDHKPYAEDSVSISLSRLFADWVLMVMAVVKEMHQRTGKDEQVWQYPEKMRPVFGQEEKQGDRQKAEKYPFPALAMR